jgi:predicted acyltransferase
VGVSIHFAYQSKIDEGLSKKNVAKILKRSTIIFLLGLMLALIPKFNIATVRIPGVLQRISIVFLCCALLYLSTQWLAQFRIVLVLLVGYFVLMTFVPVPGVGHANLEPETNLGAWLDRMILNGHLWAQSKTWDPEGLLSTLPAVATGMLGMLCGKLFSSINVPSERVAWIFFVGAILIIAGLVWGMVFPINKVLWTSSYVLYTGGIAMQLLAACYWLIDVQGIKKWSMPFVYYGTNAIFVFVASGLLAKLLLRIKLGEVENQHSLWSMIYQNAYANWLSPRNASLAFAITLILLFGLILRWMYNKKIFVKV